MAEAFAVARDRNGYQFFSAGIVPEPLHKEAVKAMAEIGIDISGQASTSLESLASVDFDVVVALCDAAAEECPPLPGRPEHVNWDLQNPETETGSREIIRKAFRDSRDHIRRLVDDFFERGYLDTFVAARRNEALILENISDGIIAHDTERRIIFFNRAAEKITGYSREEIMNKDCHAVFPGNFCGGKCVFPDSGPVTPQVLEARTHKHEAEIRAKDGGRKVVDMTVKPLTDSRDRQVGVLISFHDITRERSLARRVGEIQHFAGIIGRDEKMLELFDLIRDLADTNVPVLVQGESGTGKELVAAAIHNEGPRAGALFVPVNCGALPESLLESELFGHVKGAFTGAIRDKKGRFELADGGTIFLDEIGDITPSMQVKLMRVLQEGTFERVGSETTLQVDVRVISATNKNLAEEIAASRFRDDLYYRLSVVPIWLPPLRDRRHDIPLIVDYVLKRLLENGKHADVTVSDEAMDIMMSYDWPGNVRELQNWLQFALVKCKEKAIRPEHLPPPRDGGSRPVKRRRRRRLEIESVRDALQATDSNKVEAAKYLGVSRATLYRFLDDLTEPL